MILGNLGAIDALADADLSALRAGANALFCPSNYEPVCGHAGSRSAGSIDTYPNECAARAAGATVVTPGPCAAGTEGPWQWLPGQGSVEVSIPGLPQSLGLGLQFGPRQEVVAEPEFGESFASPLARIGESKLFKAATMIVGAWGIVKFLRGK